MYKNVKITDAKKSTGKKAGIIAICALSAIIVALIVLIILESLGVLYPSYDDGTEITPPKRASAETLTEGYYSYAILTDGTAMITNCTLAAETTEINIPDSLGGYKVTAIGESSFAMITEMQKIVVPEGVTYIGKAAFFGALNAKLYLPSTISQIDDEAMAGFDEPSGIYFAGTEAQWAEVRIGDSNAVLARVVCAEVN